MLFVKEGPNGATNAYSYRWLDKTKKGENFSGKYQQFNFQDLTYLQKTRINGKLTHTLKFAFNHAPTLDQISALKNELKSQKNPASSRKIVTNGILDFLADVKNVIGNTLGAIGCTLIGGDWDSCGGDLTDNECGSFDAACPLDGDTTSTTGNISAEDYFAAVNIHFQNSGSGGSSSGGDSSGGDSSSGSSGNSGGFTYTAGNLSSFIWTTFNLITSGTYTVSAPGYTSPGPPPELVTLTEVGAAATVLSLNTAQEASLNASRTNIWTSEIVNYAKGTLTAEQKLMGKSHIDLLATVPGYQNILNAYWSYRYANSLNEPNASLMWWDNDGFQRSTEGVRAFAELSDAASATIRDAMLAAMPETNYTSAEADPNEVHYYDNATYQEYTSSMEWKTIAPIISPKDWVYYGYQGVTDCLALSRLQAGKLGWTCNGYDAAGQTFKVWSNRTGTLVHDAVELRKGINYMLTSLNNFVPVIIGIDDRTGSPNLDGLTDHYLTVVGAGTEPDGRHFFRYYENGVGPSHLMLATHKDLKLYYDATAGTLEGTSHTGYMKNATFKVTQIRRSVSAL